MNVQVLGNFISITIQPNEGQPAAIQLPDGYSFEKIHVTVLLPYMKISSNTVYTFPAVDSKSPCFIKPVIDDVSKVSQIKLFIEKFGQIPDTHYFDKTFEPILVAADDGKEYNVIPSDQFK